MKLVALALLVLAGEALIPAQPGIVLATKSFKLPAASEVTATITADCRDCSWGMPGREAAALVIEVDRRYSQHLYLSRGAGVQQYRVSLGALSPGGHVVSTRLDREFSARDVQALRVSAIDITTNDERDKAETDKDRTHKDETDRAETDRTAMSMSPILYARPNTQGRFSDIPLLMWYEVEPKGRGKDIRYSVIFSNEDGGTPTDRLMATWGRPTDIEFIYGVELDAAGRIVSERYQGPEHEILSFRGTREGAHPQLWVVTDNNMVSDRGTTSQRFAPAPERVDLASVSREIVMDRHPWTYRVSAQEIEREGRVAPGANPGSGTIPDVRRFVYVEACGEVVDATLSFAVATEGQDGALQWHESDGGVREFRIARSGCFRGAVAPPAGVTADRIRALRFRAFTRPPKKGEAPLPAGAGTARIDRVNTVFMLTDDYTPGRKLFAWSGELRLTPNGEPGVLRF